MRVVIAEDESLLRAGARAPAARARASTSSARRRPRPELLDAGRRDPARRGASPTCGCRRATPTTAAGGASGSGPSDPGTGVVVLSQFVQRRYAVELIGANPAGVGYLLKQRVADVDRFTADVRRVAEGATALDPDVVEVMLTRVSREDGAVDRLTGRQRQVLALIAEGRANAAIAERLGVTERGVVRTCRTSTPSSACPTAPTTTAGCWRCCATWRAERSRTTGPRSGLRPEPGPLTGRRSLPEGDDDRLPRGPARRSAPTREDADDPRPVRRPSTSTPVGRRPPRRARRPRPEPGGRPGATRPGGGVRDRVVRLLEFRRIPDRLPRLHDDQRVQHADGRAGPLLRERPQPGSERALRQLGADPRRLRRVRVEGGGRSGGVPVDPRRHEVPGAVPVLLRPVAGAHLVPLDAERGLRARDLRRPVHLCGRRPAGSVRPHDGVHDRRRQGPQGPRRRPPGDHPSHGRRAVRATTTTARATRRGARSATTSPATDRSPWSGGACRPW